MWSVVRLATQLENKEIIREKSGKYVFDEKVMEKLGKFLKKVREKVKMKLF